jgi:hypothetical protein
MGTGEITNWNSFFLGYDGGRQTRGATACDEKVMMASVRKADRVLTEADVQLVGDVDRGWAATGLGPSVASRRPDRVRIRRGRLSPFLLARRACGARHPAGDA